MEEMTFEYRSLSGSTSIRSSRVRLTGLQRHLLVLAFCAALALPATAQTIWHVDDNAANDPGPGTTEVSDPLEDGSAEHPFDAIQEGIDAASDSDTVLVANGTYTGAGNRNMDYLGKTISVKAETDGESVIDLENHGRAFTLNTGESGAQLSGFKICNGFSETDDDSVIDAYGANFTVRKCDFEDDMAAVIASCGGMLTLSFCTFTHNYNMDDDSHDEGIVTIVNGHASIQYCEHVGNIGNVFYCSESGVELDRCQFESNVSASRYGHVIFVDGGDFQMSRCNVNHNAVGFGGGVFINYGAALIEKCDVAYNMNTYFTGLAAGITSGADPLIVRNCTIRRNVGGFTGGGFYIGDGHAILANCVIEGNETFMGGGGIYVDYDAEAAIRNCTIVNNETEDSIGGGVFAYTPARVSVENSIVWNNLDDYGYQIFGCGADCQLSVAYSDVTGGINGAGADDGAEFIWGAGNLDVDPGFLGSSYEPFRLQAGSACIDAGSNCAIMAYADEIGLRDRFYDDPDTVDTGAGMKPIVDIGAYEYGDGDWPARAGDFDGDGAVGLSDLALLLGYYGATDVNGDQGDMDCDFDVDLEDLAALLGRYVGGH